MSSLKTESILHALLNPDSLKITEIHGVQTPGKLNEEWWVFQNTGYVDFSFGGCTVAVDETKNWAGLPSNRRRHVLRIVPGMSLRPGQSLRVVTGQRDNWVHGSPPVDGMATYFLERAAPFINNDSDVIRIFRGSKLIAEAEFRPSSYRGIAYSNP
jgi:hypothetical protein